MRQEGLANLLQDEIETLLAPLSVVAGLSDLVKEPLRKVRQEPVNGILKGRKWSLLPLIICEAISGQFEHAIPAAAGLELLKGSAEVFDDIEDADFTESLSSKYGVALATNVASTLLILAERAFTKLSDRGVNNDIVVSILDIVNSYYTTACIGQHLDLSITPEEAALEEVYFKVTAMKAVSAVECACHIGALLAEANQKSIDLFITFGHNLGMASQIANDILGVTRMNDIAKGKITLPVIYALAQTEGKTHHLLEKVFCKHSSELTPSTDQIKDLLFSTGAIQYATIKMEYYKQQAIDNITEIGHYGVKVDQLKSLLA